MKTRLHFHSEHIGIESKPKISRSLAFYNELLTFRIEEK